MSPLNASLTDLSQRYRSALRDLDSAVRHADEDAIDSIQAQCSALHKQMTEHAQRWMDLASKTNAWHVPPRDAAAARLGTNRLPDSKSKPNANPE